MDSIWANRDSIRQELALPGSTVQISSPAGTAFYTTDGTDPRSPGGQHRAQRDGSS